MMAMEDVFYAIARTTGQPTILLCDRGTMDVAPLRSSAVAGSTAPSWRRFEIACRLSSGTVNRTLIGFNCVITTMPLVSPGVT